MCPRARGNQQKDENAVTSLLNVLKEKWENILPLPVAFESELFRWSNHWKRQEAMPDESVASIIASHANGIFFPNLRELLKILAVLPIGSTEAERSFSCLRRLHTPGGGGTRVFFGWVCAARDFKLAPHSRKISPE